MRIGDARGHQRGLDDSPRKIPASTESGYGSDDAFAANRGGLDPLPVRHHSQKGNHSLMRKIDILDRFSRFLQKRSQFE